MTARVEHILQVVKSRQETAIHSSILGDTVDGEPPVRRHRIISFWRYSTQHVSGECWSYSRIGQWTRIQMHLDDASARGTLERQRYWVTVWHSRSHRTPANVRERSNIITLRSVFFINHGIYIISCTTMVQMVRWTSLAEKRRLCLSSLHSPLEALHYVIAALWVIVVVEPSRSW
jgi:hypothetical protein